MNRDAEEEVVTISANTDSNEVREDSAVFLRDCAFTLGHKSHLSLFGLCHEFDTLNITEYEKKPEAYIINSMAYAVHCLMSELS